MPAVFKGAGILVTKGGCPCAFRGHLVWALAFWLLKVGVLVLVATRLLKVGVLVLVACFAISAYWLFE